MSTSIVIKRKRSKIDEACMQLFFISELEILFHNFINVISVYSIVNITPIFQILDFMISCGIC